MEIQVSISFLHLCFEVADHTDISNFDAFALEVLEEVVVECVWAKVANIQTAVVVVYFLLELLTC